MPRVVNRINTILTPVLNQVRIKQWIQTVLRLKSCEITEAWNWKGKHEQICGNLSLHEPFIGIYWITQIKKMSFCFLIGRQ